MTLSARRVVEPAWAEGAFDGEGNWFFGGRWTPERRHAVYLASSTALALLETMVHAPGRLLPRYVVFPVEFDESLVFSADRSRFPENWRDNPNPSDLQAVGEAWIEEGISPVLCVPSAVVPDEANYVLNPKHAEFGRVRIGASFPLDVDLRLRP